MFEYVEKGGVLVIPILICSILALAIFIERMFFFTRHKICGNGLIEEVVALLGQKKDAQAHGLLEKDATPMGRILANAMEVKDYERETLETVINNATDEEVRHLSTRLQLLATIGNITPLLGLLGTVLGMIKAFMTIQQMGGKVNAAVLAGGIWEAMLTTAFGLSVALPAMVAHSYLTGKVDRYAAQFQSGSVKFIKALTTNGNGNRPC